MKKGLAVVLIIMAILLVAVGCTVDIQYANPTVSSIAVDGISKVDYISGDKLDINGASIIVTYDNGKHETLPLTEDMLDDGSYDMNVSGEQKVIVKYAGVSTYFTVNVKKWILESVSLSSLPYVTEYVVGEEIDLTGARIECKYEGGKSKYENVTSVEEYDNQTPGTVTIYTTYSGVKMSFDVTYTEKTPISIKKVDDAKENYVFVGKGEDFKFDGMTVKIGYDNNQETAYDVGKDLADDVFVSVDDSSAKSVDAVLMYYPESYKETYKYRFYGIAKVSVDDIVKPGQELATNELDRNGTTVPLDPITSKSYGTVRSIVANEDGSRTMTVDTTVSYVLTNITVKPGDIIADGDFIGNYGTQRVYATGGGRVDDVDNGLVSVKTAPTFKFVSNVKQKSFASMTILSYPTPDVFEDTTIDNMIEGDTLDKSKGSVRVTFNDGSQEDYRMDDENYITLVNSGKDVNDTFELATGRNKILVVYGAVLENCAEFYATVEQKYPTELILSDGINGKTYYLGDKISIATMTYTVKFNNNTESDPQPLTEDMIEVGFSLDCNELTDSAQIKFKLPSAYEKIVPEGSEYTKPVCNYVVKPQPVLAAEFVVKPTKVFVNDASNISYDGAYLTVYYRNNDNLTYNFGADKDLDIKTESVEDWDDIESYDFEESDNATLYVFTRSGDNAEMAINDIVRRKQTGYDAKAVYVDAYGERCKAYWDDEGKKVETYATFRWYKINANKVVTGIKVTPLRDKDGKEYYKTTYTQYEDWDLSGLEMVVTYRNASGGEESEIIDTLYPEMIYGSDTNTVKTNVPVKFTYLGATDDTSIDINVIERKPVSLTIERTGKTSYVSNSGTKPDFSEFSFILGYNAGPSEKISGSKLSGAVNKEAKEGFWYKIYDKTGKALTSLNSTGTVVYELCYSYEDSSSAKGYSYVTTTPYDEIKYLLDNDPTNDKIKGYTFEVTANTDAVVAVSYDQNVEFDGTTLNPTYGRLLNAQSSITAIFPESNASNALPVLAESAVGWEIMLSEYVNGQIIDKMLTVVRQDADGNQTLDYVKIAPSMLDYDVADHTLGYRRVTITYMNKQCEVFIYVWRAKLGGVDVEIEPLQNYIYTAINGESDLDLTGGIIRLTFNKETRRGEAAGQMYKYVDMNSDDFTYSGFVKGLYSKEGSKITINAVYKKNTDENLRASYTITVYDRQDIDFGYNNVIFFYGNASPASYTASRSIPEFIFPSDITLNYIESKDLITLEEYLGLTEQTQSHYVPVTVYDENKNLAPVMFIKARKLNEGDEETGDIRQENYLDPAYGSYYVKLGTIYMIAEEDYALVVDTDKQYVQAVPTYGKDGDLIETFYRITDISKIGGDALKSKIKRYDGVIVDKITAEDYAKLTDEEKEKYEEEKNEYFILMRVTDNRTAKTKFYETANYATQHYAIIQKVIEVRVEDSSKKAKVLRVSTKSEGGGLYSGNPYAIYYLHSPSLGIISDIAAKYMADYTYINSVYLASPNKEYFEIAVRFTDSYVETEETKNVLAELYFDILEALFSENFKTTMEVNIVTITFGSKVTYEFNQNNKSDMYGYIKEAWSDGINIFDADDVANGDYTVSYALTFGETKTRNGVLQLLDGKLIIKEENGKYSVAEGTLSHNSYTIDLTKVTVTQNGTEVTMKK